MKLTKLFLYAPIVAMIATSCVSYQNTYRVSTIPDTKLSVQTYSVEVEHDFSKRVTGTSGSRRSVDEARNEAYYDAIVSNRVDVLVDPIYEIQTTAKVLIFGGKSTAKVTGFAGYYKNPRSQAEITAANEAKAKANADAANAAALAAQQARLKMFEEFAAQAAVAKEEAKTVILNNVTPVVCCGGCSTGNNNNTTSNVTGGTQEARTIVTTPTLSDRFNTLMGGPEGAAVVTTETKEDGTVVTVTSPSSSTPSSPAAKSKSLLNSFIGKIKSFFKRK